MQTAIASGVEPGGLLETQNTHEAFWPTWQGRLSSIRTRAGTLDWWRAGGSSGVRRDLDEARLQRLDVDGKRPQGSEHGERCGFDGAHTDDRKEDAVEIVIVPITAEPRRVRWICVGGGHQPEKGGDEKDDNGALKHAT